QRHPRGGLVGEAEPFGAGACQRLPREEARHVRRRGWEIGSEGGRCCGDEVAERAAPRPSAAPFELHRQGTLRGDEQQVSSHLTGSPEGIVPVRGVMGAGSTASSTGAGRAARESVTSAGSSSSRGAILQEPSNLTPRSMKIAGACRAPVTREGA